MKTETKQKPVQPQINADKHGSKKHNLSLATAQRFHQRSSALICG
jgi:hypothetical protein